MDLHPINSFLMSKETLQKKKADDTFSARQVRMPSLNPGFMQRIGLLNQDDMCCMYLEEPVLKS